MLPNLEKQIMFDRNFQRYIDYLRRLNEEKFCGRVTVEFYKGGISKIRKRFDPINIVEEDVILKKT